MLDFHRLKELSPGWWGAIAGGAAAGAAIVPSARIIAALVGGLAMTAIAIKLTPCCASCAEGKGCAGTATTSSTATATAPRTSVPEVLYAGVDTALPSALTCEGCS